MPVHDWTRVGAGIFHDFHLSWIGELKKVLNSGLLPPDYYALAEQMAGERGPDVLTLEAPANGPRIPPSNGAGGVAVATSPPRVWFRTTTDVDEYAAVAKVVAIRHVSDHRL